MTEPETNAFDDEATLDEQIDYLEDLCNAPDPGVDACLLDGEQGARQGDDRSRGLEWHLANAQLAIAYGERWSRAADRHDLEQAIEHGQTASAGCPGVIEWTLGEWLRERAELTGSTDDADEAVRQFEYALGDSPDVDAVWVLSYDLGRANRLRFKLTGDDAAFEQALDSLDRSVASIPPDLTGDEILLPHLERLAIYDDAQTPVGSAGADARSRRRRNAIAEAEAGLRRATTTDPYLPAKVAALIAWSELSVFANAYLEPDRDRLARHLAIARTQSDANADIRAIVTLVDTFSEQERQLSAGDLPSDGSAERLAAMLADREIVALGATGGIRKTVEQLVRVRAMSRSDARTIRSGLPPPAAGGPFPEATADENMAYLLPEMFSALQAGEHARMLDLAAERADLVRSRRNNPTFGIIGPMIALAQLSTGRPVDEQLLADPETPPAGAASNYLENIVALSRRLRALVRLAIAERDHDIARIRAIARKAEAEAEGAESDADPHVLRLARVSQAAFALGALSRADPGDAGVRDAAIAWYEQALATLGGLRTETAASMTLGLAALLRMAGPRRRARARELGWDVLVWRARLAAAQSGIDYAMRSTSAGAKDVFSVAAWCVADGAYDELVAVLDAGRGLALRAATMSRDIAGALDDIGETDLAAEWRSSNGFGHDLITSLALSAVGGEAEVPDDLRQRALDALGDTVTIEPTSVADIRGALAATGRDALVYLVAATETAFGYAVVVPASGDVRVLPLPQLRTGPESLLARYASANAGSDMTRGVRDAGVIDPVDMPTVDELCEWAWSAAIADLSRLTHQWRLGRAARIVLVPTGMLALVPWHAAYSRIGGGRRYYAVTDLVFSYAVAAHAFCESARRPLVASTAALVVGDPLGDLRFAGAEARAIHGAFYDGIGDYFGSTATPERGGTPPGTVREVLDWIAAHRDEPTTLHFACHGRIDPDEPAGAHLSLAGGEHLTARDLLSAYALSELAADRVFLAACTTNTVGGQYDEAFSLASAFATAGAGTVFGSLWRVPDADTSLLMFMVHHFLNVERAEPADALHQAQLWMLDPHRKAPATMPEELRAYAHRPEVTSPIAWASFTHMGR